MTRIRPRLLGFLVVGRRNAMRKLKTHFEQVPLEMVRTIVREQIEREKMAAVPLKTDAKKLEENPLEVIPVVRQSVR
jgi:hypothetical protein